MNNYGDEPRQTVRYGVLDMKKLLPPASAAFLCTMWI
jgi:hypothetical protein